VCFASYFANRWWIKTLVEDGFFHSHFNNLICVPFFVPIMLLAMRKLGLRPDDEPPRSLEIMIPVIIWSVLFEVVLPQHEDWGRGMTAGFKDVVYYTLGAFVAACFWAYWYRRVPRRALASNLSDRTERGQRRFHRPP
jgi:hypothetical protein